MWPNANNDTSPITCPNSGTINIPAVSGVLVNDTDPEGQTLTATVLASPSNASAFTLNSDGSYDYTHDGSATSGDFFTYTASDGQGGTDSARCDITIELVGGGAPTASGDTANVDNDTITSGVVLIDVLANDTDPSELPLTINSFTQPASGQVVQVGQELQYTALGGFHGVDTFYYDCTNGSEVSNSGQVDVTVSLISRTVLIGSTGDYVDWRAFVESTSGEYDASDPSEAGALPLTAIFQSGEIHDATRYEHDYFRGTWDEIATELTITSEGFTGKPYGTPGGNACYFRHSYGDRGFNHGTNASAFGKITWREIEIDAPNTNGTNHGLFYFRFCPNLDFTVDRCLIHGMNNTQSLCGLFYCREDHGEIKITNNLVYNLTATGASVGAFLAVNPATETDNEIRVYNNTVLDCEVNNLNSSLIRVINTDKVDLKNNVLTCSGTRPVTMAKTSVEGDANREFTFNDVDPDTITAGGASPGSFITDGFESGMNVIVNGTTSNNGTYKITAVAATTLTLDAAETLASEGPVGSGCILSAGTFVNSNSEGNVLDDNSGSDNDIFNIAIYESGETSDVYVNPSLTNLDLTHKSTSPAINVATTLTLASGIDINYITQPALDFVDRVSGAANWNAGASTDVASGEALTGTWGRYEEILTIEASGTEVIERKEFRDGLGAVVNDNGTNINLSAARVDDNGVLRVTGGCASGDWNMQQLEDWMEAVHGLWSQTHLKTPGSVATEPAVNELSSNGGEAGSQTWGLVGKTWTGAPTDDFGFQYAYTVDTGNNLITLTDFPTFTRWDTTEFRELIQFETDGASIPPNNQSFVTGTTYSTTNYSSGPNGTFNVASADWTGEGTADGRYINTPFAVETYLVELLGNVTYDSCNFILHTRGDYDQRTTAEVRFRRTGTETWTQTISARQARGHQSWDNYRFNISSTIQRLTPNTEYDLQLTLSNPSGIYADGVNEGTSYVTSTTFRTRQRPVLPTGGTTHTPTNLTEIRELLGCAGAGGTPASAGDIILLPSGDFSDKDGTNKLQDISIAVTELNPIYIQGSGTVTELPRLDFTNQASGVNWLIFDNFRIKNWGGDMASTNNYYAVSGPNGTNGNTHGIVFTRLDIQNPDIQDADIHGLAVSGERYDKQGGFFSGGANGEDHKWWNIEDCNIHLGYYPETPLSGLHNTWQPHEGFDLRTTSTVIQFSNFRNMYENSFTHTGGNGGGNLALHNEVHHNTFYAITDDWIESDESDGGHVIHDNIVNHGANWFNTNLEGLVPACIGGAGQSGWHYTAYPKYYGDFTISNSGLTNGYSSWDITNTSPNISYNSTTSIQQRTYQQYTLSGGDTFNITNHGYSNDDRVVFIGQQDVTIPSGLTKESYTVSSNQTTGDRPEAVTEYYVVNANANDFQVSLTQGGAAVNGIVDSASASGRYVGGPDRDLWVASQDWATNAAKITTRMSGSYPTRTEYQNTAGPDQDFPVLIDNSRRTSIAFSGYRIFSLQDNIGGVPHWLINNQCSGNMLVGSSDGVLKIKVDGASLNMLGQVIHCQYQWFRSERMEKNASQYWTNCIYLQQSNGYFSTSNYGIGTGPTAGTTGSPICTRYTYWDRNGWFNADVSRNLLGQGTVPNMTTAYCIDANSNEILTPVSGDLLNFWAESDSPVMTPEPGNFWDSDYGTKERMFANQAGNLYGEGSSNSDLPGVDHVQGPYITATDSSNLSFMTTKAQNRRDVGPNQAGLPTPHGSRSYTDYLSYILPSGWEVKSPGSDYSSLGVHPGSGVERLIIGKTDNSAAILIEHEDVDELITNFIYKA